jgi:hypothetical protein
MQATTDEAARSARGSFAPGPMTRLSAVAGVQGSFDDE